MSHTGEWKPSGSVCLILLNHFLHSATVLLGQSNTLIKCVISSQDNFIIICCGQNINMLHVRSWLFWMSCSRSTVYSWEQLLGQFLSIYSQVLKTGFLCFFQSQIQALFKHLQGAFSSFSSTSAVTNYIFVYCRYFTYNI